MVLLALSLLSIVVVATLVVVFVAFPQQGRTIPNAPWLTGALQRLVDRTGLDPDEDEAATGGSLNEFQVQWRDQRRERASRTPPNDDDRMHEVGPRS